MPALTRTVLLLALAMSACRGKPKKLDVPGVCKTPEVVECLQDYAFEEMSDSDVARLAREGIPKCLSEDPLTRARRKRCLPQVMGKDRRGHEIVLRYDCAESCTPDAGEVVIEVRASLEACCEGGHYPSRPAVAYREPVGGTCEHREFVRARTEDGSIRASHCERLLGKAQR